MRDPFHLHLADEKHLVAVFQCQPFQVDIVYIARCLGRKFDGLREIAECRDEGGEVFQANLRRCDIQFDGRMIQQIGRTNCFTGMDMGAVYFKIRFRQLDFKVVNDRAVLVGYDVERQFVQRKARSLVETHLLDVGIEAVLVECLHRDLGTYVPDVDMFGIELSGVAAAFFTS